ncbi:hypothetical protein K491DRAFT_710326 [Lophiostoma macrostomum CBS 122681]|uniref:DUF4419 domain-containing protein n=1 Tax=Lophiostoma macrostomum CBS 122681 TaxID=1314788 RepID=A0A6A6TPB2_9PLEO|nr:hypothetical protein K491DRAFT_710326 [Lophiostoma macrostomum CBS 122681]
MAITIIPSNTRPLAYNDEGIAQPVDSVQALFRQSCPREHHSNTNATVHLSNFDHFDEDGAKIYPTSDGFIRGTIDAWAQHQHLVLRPDEVWFEVLVQMNFYMSKNAEAVRHLFVAHEGKQDIAVSDITWEETILMFKDAIQERVKTDWLLEWIMPNFSTSTEDDTMTANVLMMGLMQHYFDFTASIICGLPSVTLLGEKADWQSLLAKLDRLPAFGDQPASYATQLEPIISRFVRSFDDPDSEETKGFWNTIVHAEATDSNLCGAPPFYLSGWLMGFLFWDTKGNRLQKSQNYPSTPRLTLDGVKYGHLSIEDLPVGYAQAPLKMIDFAGMHEFPAYVIAGNMAKRVRKGVPDGYASALKRFNGSHADLDLPHGTLEPLSGWMVYGPVTDGKGWGGNSEIKWIEKSLRRSWDSQHGGRDPNPDADRFEGFDFVDETGSDELWHDRTR